MVGYRIRFFGKDEESKKNGDKKEESMPDILFFVEREMKIFIIRILIDMKERKKNRREVERKENNTEKIGKFFH